MKLITIILSIALAGTAWAGKDKVEPQLRLEIDLVDGSHILGVSRIKSVPVQTPYAKVDVPLKEVRSIRIGGDHETAALDLRNGDKIKGVISLSPIKLETLFGKVSVGVELVRELRVVLTGGALPETLKHGLVLYYSFDWDEGGKVTDKSGNGNDGKVQGAVWVADEMSGGAYSFNGRDNRILINNHPSLELGTGARTIGAWIKNCGDTRDYQAIFTKGTNPGYSFRLAPSPARAIEYFKSAGENYSFFTASHSISDNAWHHLAVVDRGNGTADFYKDGTLLETVTKTNYNSDSTGDAAIGARHDVFGQVFNGLIDEVRIYNRALSSDEINALSSSLKP